MPLSCHTLANSLWPMMQLMSSTASLPRGAISQSVGIGLKERAGLEKVWRGGILCVTVLAGNTPSKQPSELRYYFQTCYGITSTVPAVVLLVALTVDWQDGHCYSTGSMSVCLVSNQMNYTRGSELLANATVQLPETVVWPDEVVFSWSW
jgi:hypothetical protein